MREVNKTANDYRKELNELDSKIRSLELKIRTRAISLMIANPNVLIEHFENKPAVSLINYLNEYSIQPILYIIETIETELAKKEPFIQGKLFEVIE